MLVCCICTWSLPIAISANCFPFLKKNEKIHLQSFTSSVTIQSLSLLELVCFLRITCDPLYNGNLASKTWQKSSHSTLFCSICGYCLRSRRGLFSADAQVWTGQAEPQELEVPCWPQKEKQRTGKMTSRQTEVKLRPQKVKGKTPPPPNKTKHKPQKQPNKKPPITNSFTNSFTKQTLNGRSQMHGR